MASGRIVIEYDAARSGVKAESQIVGLNPLQLMMMVLAMVQAAGQLVQIIQKSNEGEEKKQS